MAKFVIDAGHGGYDNGAVYNGRREKDDNLKLATLVGEYLRKNGEEVVYTRTEDVYDSPAEKAGIANATNADYFISFHRNAAYSPNTYSGVQVLLYNEKGSKKRIADAINASLEELGFNNLGTEVRTDLAVLRRTKMPALLVETGFIDNDYDNKIYDSDVNKLAMAIGDAIIKSLYRSVASTGLSNESVYSINDERVKPKPYRVYYIQMGLFRVYKYAVELARELTIEGYDTRIIMEGQYYAVVITGLDNKNDAIKLEKELREKGYDTLIIEKENTYKLI